MVHGIDFRSESVRLDGKHFVNCVCEDCTLEYSGGDLAFERCTILKCRHVFYGYARQTAQYMREVGLTNGENENWTEWAGIVN